MLAAEKGGKFLSPEYKGNGRKHEWECPEQHTWMATPNRIQQGTWCPVCSSLLSERLTRVHFEEIFSASFPTRKPIWLINSRGNRMELDGYNEELGLAFEYHGIQHYKFNRRFHQSRNDFLQRRKDDRRKASLCKAVGVTLIEVPYTVELSEMKRFIIAQCENAGIRTDDSMWTAKIDMRKAYSARGIEKMKMMAEKNHGKCLSRHYVNAHTPLRWQCKKGHTWEAKPNYVQQGLWCKECKTIERQRAAKKLLDEIANSRGGLCLSEKYTNSYTKLEWQCANGHKWLATPYAIKQGYWCRKCD